MPLIVYIISKMESHVEIPDKVLIVHPKKLRAGATRNPDRRGSEYVMLARQ